MADFVLPSKLVPEKVTVSFDFSGDLAWGETVVSQQVWLKVEAGIDPYPDHMLRGVASSLAGVVKQRVQLGVPGVIYLLTCRATGSTGQVYLQTARLAVLTAPAVSVPLFGLFLTSRLYPVEVTEAIAVFSNVVKAGMLTPGLEGFVLSSNVVAGTLRAILTAYSNWPPEGLAISSNVLAGILRAILVTYSNWPPEGFAIASNVTAGTLKVVLITYSNYPPEGFAISSNVLAGTLT